MKKSAGSLQGLVALFFLTGLLALAACDQADDGKSGGPLFNGRDSMVTSAPRPSLAEPRVRTNTGWDASAGTFLVLPDLAGGLISGSLVRPAALGNTISDTSGVGLEMGDGRLELFSRAGRVGAATLHVDAAIPGASGCTAWPVARLDLDGGTVSAPWTAAFMSGRVLALPLDSIAGLSPRDSASMVANIARLASTLPDDTSETFRPLPLVVLGAWRSSGVGTADSADTGFIVATLMRRLNQEDDPREERIIIVINTPSDKVSDWTVGWHERASGLEEELIVAEPLLAYHTVNSPTVHLLFGRDDGVSPGAVIIVRSEMTWRELWESAPVECDGA